jgi:hypothetical protein
MDHGFGTADTPRGSTEYPSAWPGAAFAAGALCACSRCHGRNGAGGNRRPQRHVWCPARCPYKQPITRVAAGPHRPTAFPCCCATPVRRRVWRPCTPALRGTRQNIAGACVRRMTDDLGCRAADIHAVLGPSIFAAIIPWTKPCSGLFAQSARTPQRFPWLDLPRGKWWRSCWTAALQPGWWRAGARQPAADPRFASWPPRTPRTCRLVNVIGENLG